VVVPGGQHSPAGGAPGVQINALQKAVGAEDVSTHSGENLVAFPSERVDGLHADWARDGGDGWTGGGNRRAVLAARGHDGGS